MIANKICKVCLEIQANDKFIQMPTCSHEFCEGCFKEKYQQLIDSNQINQDSFKCFACQKTYNPSLIVAKAKLDQNRMNKFCEQLIQKNIIYNTKQAEIFVECYNPACDNKFFINLNTENQECNKCKNVYCRKCKQLYHSAISCEEAMKRNQGVQQISQESMILNNMGISKCPKCKTRIEKIRGCNFITCPSRLCKNEAHFCYKCLVPLKIEEECKHYENNDPYQGKCRVLVNGHWVDKEKARQISVMPSIISNQSQISQSNLMPSIISNQSEISQISEYEEQGPILINPDSQIYQPNNRIRIINQINMVRCPYCQSNNPDTTQVMDRHLLYCDSLLCQGLFVCLQCTQILDYQDFDQHFNENYDCILNQ